MMASRSDSVSPPKHVWWYRFSYFILKRIALFPLRCKYHVKSKKYKPKPKDASIVVVNHAAHFDFVNYVSIFPYYIRYIVTDAAIRKPFPRFILPKILDFIYRRKGKVADDVVESVKLTIEKGINVEVYPEGSVTHNGATLPVRKRTGQMVKDCGAGLITIRSRGSYFSKPDWAKHQSNGPIFGEVIGVYSKDKIAKMTPDEINELIAKDIHFNIYEWNRKERIVYDRECRAECMERVVYVCPSCKRIHTLKSEKDSLFCTECGYKVDVDEYGFFIGKNVIFDNLYDWDVWQINEMKSRRQDWIDNPDVPIFELHNQKIESVDGDIPVSLCDDADVIVTSKGLIMKGTNFEMNVDINDIISFAPVHRDTTGVNISGKFYQIASKTPIDNRSMRTVHKILTNSQIT